MAEVTRLSMSLEPELLSRFEALVERRGYRNRSEFIRDLIREQLVLDQWDRDRQAVGTITLVYDHHQRQLSQRLTELQHHHHESVMATTHVHLTESTCIEMILVRGRAADLRHLVDRLRQEKGVFHAGLTMSATEDILE